MRPITRGALTAIVGASVGAVLGVAAEDAIHGSLGMSTTVAIAACVSIVALLFLVSSLFGSIEKHSEAVVESAARSTAASDHASKRVLDGLDDLRRQFGQTIEYQLLDQFDSTYEENLTRAVERAEREILVLDLLDDSGRRPANAMKAGLLDDFLDALIRVAAEKPAVLYHRITQTPQPDAATIASASSIYVRHCAEMCERREAGAKNILLRAAGIRYPFKFILIDRTSLMLQLNRVSRDGEGRREAWCEIFFANADPELIRAFVDMWHDVDHDPQTRTVTSDQVAAVDDQSSSAAALTT